MFEISSRPATLAIEHRITNIEFRMRLLQNTRTSEPRKPMLRGSLLECGQRLCWPLWSPLPHEPVATLLPT